MFFKPQFCVIILAFFVWDVTTFSLQFMGNMKHPDLPNHCYFEEYNITVPVNHTVYPTNLDSVCFKVYCREDYVLQIKHCDRVMTHRYCNESPYDFSKPYPQCCPIIKCKNDI
ncbi:uncharacterized protein ACRADG_006805 [Cochliomyia hominivorax]